MSISVLISSKFCNFNGLHCKRFRAMLKFRNLRLSLCTGQIFYYFGVKFF